MTIATTASGTHYFYNKKEQKIPIVFIHGVGLNYEIWKPQLDFFKNQSVLAYDILGHGKSSLNKKNITFDDLADQIIDLTNELGIERMHLVGFSIGSLIARNFASRFNERLQSLVLIGSIYKRSDEQQKIVNQRFEQAKKELKLSKQALKRWFTDKYLEKNSDIYKKISSIISSNNIENFLKLYELFVNHENKENFDKIKVNTLIITGELDMGSTIQMAKELNEIIDNSSLKIIQNGKHLCSIECADEVNLSIKNFLDINE
tara:strand:- start:659 stop:1441 length:783 start_codon:yes stop_codon:yes gene_type:complete